MTIPVLQTLPDWLEPGLRIVSVGVNPSIPSAKAGFPFANPRNRFWPALNASHLIPEPLQPGVEAMQILLMRERIGFTDVVKRPSAMEKDLCAAEFRTGAEVLLQKLKHCQPRVIWLHGKKPLEMLCRAAGVKADMDWGLQQVRIEGMSLFATPNPSPANAAFSLQALTGWYDQLAEYLRPMQ